MLSYDTQSDSIPTASLERPLGIEKRNAMPLLLFMPPRAPTLCVCHATMLPCHRPHALHHRFIGETSRLPILESCSKGSSNSLPGLVPLDSQCLYVASGFLGPVMTISTSPMSSSMWRFFSASWRRVCWRLRRTIMVRTMARTMKRLPDTRVSDQIMYRRVVLVECAYVRLMINGTPVVKNLLV